MTRHFKKFVFLSLLFLLHPFTQALPTFIEGTVKNGNGLVIRIYAYSDHLSFQEVLLDLNEIDATENFQLGFEIVDIQEVFIRIGNQSFSFFAEPGKSYQIKIENVESPPKSAISEQKPLHLIWSEKNSLNEAIDNFNYSFSAFLEKNFINLYKYRDAKLLQSFEDEMLVKLQNTSTLSSKEKTFFGNYIAYQLADLKNASRTVSVSKLGETYLQNKEVLYNHPRYMMFFNHYFSKYIVAGNGTVNYNEFIGLIQNGANKTKLLDFMGENPVLNQERLREFVLLSILHEAYYNKDFSAEQIKTLINEIATTSKFIEHQNIGAAVLNQLTTLQIGTPAPEFKLKSTKGISKSLENYKGRYVYMVFLADFCQACESDLVSIEKLHEKYNNDIAVLGILVNYTKEGLTKFKNNNNTNWDKLLFDNDFDLLNTYRVRNYPLYMLLDREGNILLNPAKKPHEDIDRYFDFLIKRDKDREKKPDILFR